MLHLDGGEAGGQFLRTALTLSILEDRPVRIENVRGNRDSPGLAAQHVTVLDTLARLSDATVTGDALGATTIEFEPGTLRAQALAVDVGTAGSIALVFDAILPLAARIADPIHVTATGGTDVTWSPPLGFLTRVKLPLLRQHGVMAAVERERTGFYPAGGGRATLHVAPSTCTPFALTDRGTGRGVDVVSIASEGLADADVAERQAAAAVDRIEDSGLTVRHETTTYADTACPGTSVLVALAYEQTRAGFDALGEPGLPAEDVGQEAADAAIDFHEGGAVVDEHLADQLLVFAALAGGSIVIPRLTAHVETSLGLLESFGLEVAVEEVPGAVRLTVETGLALDSGGR